MPIIALMSSTFPQGFLLSGSVDGMIRIWQITENPCPGAVLEATPSYSHPPIAAAALPDPEVGHAVAADLLVILHSGSLEELQSDTLAKGSDGQIVAHMQADVHEGCWV